MTQKARLSCVAGGPSHGDWLPFVWKSFSFRWIGYGCLQGRIGSGAGSTSTHCECDGVCEAVRTVQVCQDSFDQVAGSIFVAEDSDEAGTCDVELELPFLELGGGDGAGDEVIGLRLCNDVRESGAVCEVVEPPAGV